MTCISACIYYTFYTIAVDLGKERASELVGQGSKPLITLAARDSMNDSPQSLCVTEMTKLTGAVGKISIAKR